MSMIIPKTRAYVWIVMLVFIMALGVVCWYVRDLYEQQQMVRHEVLHLWGNVTSLNASVINLRWDIEDGLMQGSDRQEALAELEENLGLGSE